MLLCVCMRLSVVEIDEGEAKWNRDSMGAGAGAAAYYCGTRCMHSGLDHEILFAWEDHCTQGLTPAGLSFFSNTPAWKEASNRCRRLFSVDALMQMHESLASLQLLDGVAPNPLWLYCSYEFISAQKPAGPLLFTIDGVCSAKESVDRLLD
jgi:hypothetical protein